MRFVEEVMTAKQAGFSFGRSYALRVLQNESGITFDELFAGCFDAAKRNPKVQWAFREWLEITVVDMVGQFEEGIAEGIQKAGWQLGIKLANRPF